MDQLEGKISELKDREIYKYSDVNKENKESRNRYCKTSETPLKGQIYDLKKEKEKQGVVTN